MDVGECAGLFDAPNGVDDGVDLLHTPLGDFTGEHMDLAFLALSLLRDDGGAHGAFKEMGRTDIGVRYQVHQCGFARLHRAHHQDDEGAVGIFLGAVFCLVQLMDDFGAAA